MLPSKVKDWMVAGLWEDMDQAIYSVNKLKLLNGAYWFWLMSDYDQNNPRMLQVLVSCGALDYNLNDKHFTNKQSGDDKFTCYCGIWEYRDGKVSDLVHDSCDCTVTKGKFLCVTESGYEISITNSFPDYDMIVKNRDLVVTKFRSVSSKFKGGYIQNPLVSYPSGIAYSEDFDAYARNSRGFQHFYASKMSDLFATCDGELFGRDFQGSFWLERALGFGSMLPWKIVMVNFSDKSRLWYRYFPSKFLNYGTPLEFIFDDMVTKKRYHFSEMKFEYTGSNHGPTMKFSPDMDTIHLSASGDHGEKIRLTAKILDRHLYKYDVARIKFNYNQLVLEVEDIEAIVDGTDLMQGKEQTLSYGEDAYFSL